MEGVPLILTIFKLCKKFGIENSMIKSLNYNDLLYMIIAFQTEEVKKYLGRTKQNRGQNVTYPDDKELTLFLRGKLPKAKEVM